MVDMKNGVWISKILKIIMIVIVFLIGVTTIASCSFAKEKREEKILFISSYHPNFLTFSDQIDGIQAGLTGEYQLDFEFMDTKRLNTEENIQNFYRMLAYKLENVRYDLIILGDDNALQFALIYQEELFPEMPMVFLGVNDISVAKAMDKNPRITGIVEAVSIDETIEIALQLNPSAKRVIAIVDNTLSGQGDLITFMELAPNYSGLEFLAINFKTHRFGEIKSELSRIHQGDIVVLLSLYTDAKESSISFEEGLALLSEVTGPIYHPYMHGIGQGLFGGKVISHFEQGRLAGILAERILKGEAISEIPIIIEGQNRYVFDYELLKHYGIEQSELPDNSILINKTPGFFKTNARLILIIFWVFAGLLLVIFVLLRSIRLKKTSEKALRHKTEELLGKNQEIQRLLSIDRLTTLKNRHSISERIEATIEHAKEGTRIGIVFLDIDNFKLINDTHGHDIGDLVIQGTADRLVDLRGEHVEVARFGGDEFLIMIEASDREEILSVVATIMERFKKSIDIDGTRFDLSVSMGVSFFPENGKNFKELIQRSDQALYAAKDNGRNQIVVFEPRMLAELQENLAFQKTLKRAFEEGEFHLNYQPIYNVSLKKIEFFEALIRWKSETYGQVSPLKMIECAERIGMIGQIDQWVLAEASRFIKKINRLCEEKYQMAVNVSALEIMKVDFVEDILNTIETTGVDPTCIKVEMTESVLIESYEKGMQAFQKLRKAGVTIALDDFGSGYSSLMYLGKFPVDVLKIDRYFVENIVSNDQDYDLFKAIIDIAHKKGISVVAEGVETKEQMSLIEATDCDYIQGYFLNRPMSEEKILKLLNRKE